MHLWRKMRRVWLSVSANLKPLKPTGGRKGGGRSDAAGAGLLKLQDDVKTCEYGDVQVMWNLLNTSQTQIKQIGEAAATATAATTTTTTRSTAVSHRDHLQPGKYCSKERHSWLAFFWPKLRATPSPSSSPFGWFKSSKIAY